MRPETSSGYSDVNKATTVKAKATTFKGKAKTNSTQLNRELRTQVSDTSKSAS